MKPAACPLDVYKRQHWESLEAFHAFHSEARILDYTISNRRFVRFHRPGVQFEICYSPSPFGVQTCEMCIRDRPGAAKSKSRRNC